MTRTHSYNENSTEPKCRWTSYGNYRIILWAWMMNEVGIMFSPTEISHNGFYFHAFLQTLSVTFIGIPLVYSEICLAQYTNCDVFTMWNFFPLFRNVGFGTIYLIILKTVYLMVLTSWYVKYTYYASLDPPPWFTCDGFTHEKCMVKSVNVSIFQHCLEAQLLFDDDCGMKTASNCFFEREIGNNNTGTLSKCIFQWKAIIASSSISMLLFILSLKRDKLTQILVKFVAGYVFVVLLILFCVALSTSGTWYASTIKLHWSNVDFDSFYDSIGRGFLTLGTGCGIVIFLSRDAPFRSPATMTSISVSLFALFSTVMLALISFSGIKTMSFYHGEEENVIEIGASMYFSSFASISEVMTYFDALPLWGFAWFSAISLCLFCNIWILHLFLSDLLQEFNIVRKYRKASEFILILSICFCSWPFFCADLTGVLTDATELIQVINNILFSVTFYWIYGYKNHNVDVVFMIGIKSKYFWNIAWFMNPILLMTILFFRSKDLTVRTYGPSYRIDSLSIEVDWLLLWTLLGIYIFLIFTGILMQLIPYLYHGHTKYLFIPSHLWGPRDLILYKSRKMFVPEIMTTEFLYRQVRIRGYCRQQKDNMLKTKREAKESIVPSNTEWSALTSN